MWFFINAGIRINRLLVKNGQSNYLLEDMDSMDSMESAPEWYIHYPSAANVRKFIFHQKAETLSSDTTDDWSAFWWRCILDTGLSIKWLATEYCAWRQSDTQK